MRQDIAIDWARVCAVSEEPMGTMDDGYMTAVHFEGGKSLYFHREHLNHQEALMRWEPYRKDIAAWRQRA